MITKTNLEAQDEEKMKNQKIVRSAQYLMSDRGQQ
jgi:hypothetical protein